MDHGEVGQRYILGGEHIPLRRVDMVVAIRRRNGIHVRIPAGFAHMTAAMMEFLADHVTRRPPAATAEAIRIAVRSKALSSQKSRRELGYTPRPIEPTWRRLRAVRTDRGGASPVGGPHPLAGLSRKRQGHDGSSKRHT